MDAKEKKKLYNARYMAKQKAKQEQEKEEPKVEIKKVKIVEPDSDDDEIITEDAINDMVNERVKQQMNFFLKNNKTKDIQKIETQITKKETSPMMQEIYKSLILMSIPMIVKGAVQIVGRTLLTNIKPQLLPQEHTNTQQESFMTHSPFSTC